MSDLSTGEQKNVRAALRFLKVRCGGVIPLAKALRIDRTTLNTPPSPTTAYRVAKFAGVSVDDVLTGKFPPAGACPHCGQARSP